MNLRTSTQLSVRSRLCAFLTGCTATLALVVASASADAATITVNTFSQIAPGQCTIATAIASINAAADQVGCTHAGTYGTSDTINLAAGTYASTVIDNGQNAYPVINVALIINGNGATLSRTVGGVAPFFRFFEVGGGGLTLNNATLTGGNTTGGASGGAILVDGSTALLSVSGSTFSNNIAAGSGGAISEDSDLAFTITNTTFTGNTAAGGGGGAIIDNTTGGMSLTNTTFTSNNTSGGGGGAVLDNSTVGLTINTATFTGNSATGGGGGAILDNSSGGLVFNCGNVTNNSVVTAGNNGGGILDNSTNGMRITGVAFSGNSATFRGGAIFDDSTVGTGPVSNNSFAGNSATSGGGGIYRTPPTLNAINNWWGAASGPSGAGPGTGDAVSIDVTFAPFLTSPPSACGAGPPPSTSQPIPTLSGWTLWVVTFLLLVGGMWAIRRRVR